MDPAENGPPAAPSPTLPTRPPPGLEQVADASALNTSHNMNVVQVHPQGQAGSGIYDSAGRSMSVPPGFSPHASPFFPNQPYSNQPQQNKPRRAVREWPPSGPGHWNPGPPQTAVSPGKIQPPPGFHPQSPLSGFSSAAEDTAPDTPTPVDSRTPSFPSNFPGYWPLAHSHHQHRTMYTSRIRPPPQPVARPVSAEHAVDAPIAPPTSYAAAVTQGLAPNSVGYHPQQVATNVAPGHSQTGTCPSGALVSTPENQHASPVATDPANVGHVGIDLDAMGVQAQSQGQQQRVQVQAEGDRQSQKSPQVRAYEREQAEYQARVRAYAEQQWQQQAYNAAQHTLAVAQAHLQAIVQAQEITTTPDQQDQGLKNQERAQQHIEALAAVRAAHVARARAAATHAHHAQQQQRLEAAAAAARHESGSNAHPLIKEVEPGSGLYLADPRFANNPALLRSNGITAVVSLTASPNALLWNSDEYRSVIPRNRHLWIPSLDSNTQDLLQHFHRISEFITRQLRPWWKDPWEKEQASAIGFGPDDDLEFIPNLLTDDHHRKGPGRPAGEKLRSLTPRPTRRVLVHCLDNLSRSKAVLAAHVMCKRGWGLRKTMNKLPAVRPANQAFMEQLRIWEELECDIFEDDEKVKGGKVFKARYREFRKALEKLRDGNGDVYAYGWAP